MRQFLILTLVISLLGAFSISAHDDDKDKEKEMGHGRMGKEHFKKIDTNGDGKLSKDEWQKFHDARFAELDKDADGTISEDEMQSFHKEKRKEMKKKK